MQEKEEVVNVGGSIEKAKKGDYNLDVEAILKEAWMITKTSRLSIVVGLLICLLLGMLVTFIATSMMGGIEVVFKDPQTGTLLNIIVTLVIYPLLAGVDMMGVFHAVGLKTRPQLVFSFLKRGSWVAVCALLSSTFITIGMALLYLPGIFLAVSLSLSLPLVIEKQLSPMKAIILCVQATRFQWFKIFSLYLVLALALVLAFLPIMLIGASGFGVIAGAFFMFCFAYIAPMFYNVKGILYREIFGLQVQSSPNMPNSISTTFSA